MTQKFGQILRKDNVKITGSCRIDLSGNTIHSPLTSPGSQEKSAQPQIKIMESTAQVMVLEFTCSCGCKTYIQCDYA
jgi:hypothetical protein